MIILVDYQPYTGWELAQRVETTAVNSEQNIINRLHPNSLKKRGYVLDQTERHSTDGDVVGVEERFEQTIRRFLFLD